MPRRNVFVIAVVVVVLSAITIVATESIDDQRAAAPPVTAPSTDVDDVIVDVSTTTTTTTTSTTSTTTTTTTVPPGVDAVDALLRELDDHAVAQQLVVLGGSGVAETSIEASVGDVCLGGVFITSTAGNWSPSGSVEAATTAIAAIAEAAATCPAPPFIATDAEAGTRVLRVPVDPLPSPATLEANHQADPATTSEGLAPATADFAGALASLGVDVNFGVVADVDAGDGFYMGRQGRSFGADAATVTAITESLVEGHCQAGVAAALKHFPNQGSTVDDPHRLDSFSVNDVVAWRALGALPYEQTQAPLVMIGHVRYPDIDDGLPATLSPTIITGWLRTDLGYDGVVITDDLLAMRGVGGDLSIPDRAVAAIDAGADLALFVGAGEGDAIVEAIVQRMATDADFAERARISVRRVLDLKGGLGLLPETDPDWFRLCGSAQ